MAFQKHSCKILVQIPTCRVGRKKSRFFTPFWCYFETFFSKMHQALGKKSKYIIDVLFEFKTSKRLSKNILIKFWWKFWSVGWVGKNHDFLPLFGAILTLFSQKCTKRLKKGKNVKSMYFSSSIPRKGFLKTFSSNFCKNSNLQGG